MQLILVILSFFTGAVLSYIVFYLFNKTKNVAKAEYDSLNARAIESNTQLKIAEARNAAYQEEFLKYKTKLDANDLELNRLLSKSSSLETENKNNEQKISELLNNTSEQINNINSLQKEINSLKESLAESHANNHFTKNNLVSQSEISQKQKVEIENLIEKNNKLTGENSHLLANNSALLEKLETQKLEIIEIQKTSHLQFEKIANKILEDKTGKFTETNKINMEALLKPLGENISQFKQKVEETYDKESKQRFSLEEKVKELVEQTNKVSSEANNLATALKGQSKKQGDWGEVILESILQRSGLVKDREYFLQKNIKDDGGNNLRPDVLIQLPDERIIIVDSKVSLVAYDKFCSAESLKDQSIYLADLLRSMRQHIDDLSGKKYDNIEASLDFTMMFIPIEPAYLVAIQGDQDLWAYAYSKRIMLISPTNLIACLRLMADLWKREWQNKNALKIVNRGEKLYEKFVNFVGSLEEIGKNINNSQTAYNTAISQLNTGKGNLISQAQTLKDLGLKSSKEIPESMIAGEIEEVEPVKIKLL